MRLRDLEVVNVRQAFDRVRVVYVWVIPHDFGPYAKTPLLIPFGRFPDFFFEFSADHFAQRAAVVGDAFNKRDPKELTLLNEAIVDYFVGHLPNIRRKLRSMGYGGASWDKLLTKEAVEWMMSSANEFRKSGNKIVHETNADLIVNSVISLRTEVVDETIGDYLLACGDIYRHVHQFVDTVIDRK